MYPIWIEMLFRWLLDRWRWCSVHRWPQAVRSCQYSCQRQFVPTAYTSSLLLLSGIKKWHHFFSPPFKGPLVVASSFAHERSTPWHTFIDKNCIFLLNKSWNSIERKQIKHKIRFFSVLMFALWYHAAAWSTIRDLHYYSHSFSISKNPFNPHF